MHIKQNHIKKIWKIHKKRENIFKKMRKNLRCIWGEKKLNEFSMDLIGSLVSERAMNFYKCLPEVSLFENEMK